MRTQQEIIDRMVERKEDDALGFEADEYVYFLDFAHAKKLLSGINNAEWNKVYKEPTRENVIGQMQDYLNFAWRKADNERGISANRSIMHYIAWIWLAGDDDFLQQVQDEYDNNYSDYGKPILRMIEAYYKLVR